MIKNYIKVALRGLAKHKGFTFLNVFGLAVGMACALFIVLLVEFELSYDQFHENLDQIYRLEQDQQQETGKFHVNIMSFPMGPATVDEIPEVTNAARYAGTGTMLVNYGELKFYENGIRQVDPSFFDMFTFPFVTGSPSSFSGDPYSLVLTREIAEKYFPDEEALDKVITLDNMLEFTVVGVIENVPGASTMQFDMLVPFDFDGNQMGDNAESWGSNNVTTYIQVTGDPGLAVLQTKLTDLVKRRRSETTTVYMARPMADIYLRGYFGFANSSESVRRIYLFVAAAFFVLLIACINYMNLATAKSTQRAKEIGLRKVRN